MALTLHLGVIDVPYRAGPARRRRRAVVKSTGDVAEILEVRYGVMEAFYRVHEGEVISDIEGALQGTIESFVMGAPLRLDPFGSGLSKVEDRFKQFLSSREAERVGIPGTPTQAALRGVSHRFKRPYVRRASRPSFIDTGQYQAAFRAWID